MKEALDYVAPWLVGLGLGAFFFGGLWWTVRRGVASRHAALWFAGSSLARMGVALAGMYWCTGGDWKKLAVCIFGFLIARMLVTRFAGPPLAAAQPVAAEDGNASES